MLASIIIPVLNEEAEITRTLNAVQNLGGEKEIIVVDGGSTDCTVELVRQQPVRLVQSAKGRGMQLHAGASVATGDVLWFVHADTTPPTHALWEIEQILQNPKVIGGNFGLLFDGPSRSARQLTIIYPFLRILRLCYGDSGYFVRRHVYDKIGGFRALALFEDLDLLRRLRRVGRFKHLPCRITTSSRRFEKRNFALIWLHWTILQVLYWCGVSPNRLARWYQHTRRLVE